MMIRFNYLSIFIIFSVISLSTPSKGENIRERKLGAGANFSNNCFLAETLRLDESGLVTVRFRNLTDKSSSCENVIYNVWTNPNDQIRGARGINGRVADEIFEIQVSPSTVSIWFEYLSGSGTVNTAFTSIKQEILEIKRRIEAENSIPSWQKAFQSTETKLAETAAADKTPPTVQVLAPAPADGQVTRVDTYTSFIRGKVTDDAGVMTILVAGRKVGIKEDGTFASKVKLAIGRNDVLVQAEDINGNVSEKTVTFIREEFITDDVLADVDLPPQTKMSNPDALAVVIGVENYQYVPDATYAYNDAEVFREYLAETLGMKRQRIKLATNTKATQAEFTKLLGPNGWLARNIVKGKSDVVVYFSGHGIASPDAMSSGILPFDVDPNYSVGLPTEQLYKDLSAMGARSVTVFLDACFTGQTRSSEMLIANARPIVVRPKASSVPSNVTVISAASGTQISGAIEEKEHGLFTYYVLKGLGGEADGNKDAVLKTDELSAYVSSKVQEQAALSGREQTPELQGDAGRVLVRFQ